eukprot:12464772-Alexandrium_andersonii.AAC.1
MPMPNNGVPGQEEHCATETRWECEANPNALTPRNTCKRSPRQVAWQHKLGPIEPLARLRSRTQAAHVGWR